MPTGSTPPKLLIDPYAKAIDGPIDFSAAKRAPTRRPTPTSSLIGATGGRHPQAASSSTSTSMEGLLPRRWWHETVIDEMYVKGFTRRHLVSGDDLQDDEVRLEMAIDLTPLV